MRSPPPPLAIGSYRGINHDGCIDHKVAMPLGMEAPYAFLAPYIIIKEAMQKPSYKTQQRISLKL
jgi:hypothetical protein